MDRVELEILGLSSSQSQSGSFALVLGEREGKRRLPIIIGMFEAQAIAIELEKITPNRPMTHDLFVNFSEAFGIDVQEIEICDLKEGVFFAKIVCDSNQGRVELDARPSDAIAIGLRFGAPIYALEKIMAEAGILLSETEEDAELLGGKDEDEEEEAKAEKQMSRVEVQKGKIPETLGDFSHDQLSAMLDDAIKSEQYELAARLRDELNRRGSSS